MSGCKFPNDVCPAKTIHEVKIALQGVLDEHLVSATTSEGLQSEK